MVVQDSSHGKEDKDEDELMQVDSNNLVCECFIGFDKVL